MIGNTTIAAISTPSGVGGVACIRVSGADSIAIVDSLFHSPSGKKLAEQRANTIHFGELRWRRELVDEVLVSLFRAPHSFTGEDTVEISCHGSLYVQQRVLEVLLAEGATLAAAGEFSRRAFLNGKMDLSQAEAVADLIASTSAASHRLAINQMRGAFSDELAKLRAQLLDFGSLIELELDFSEEDVEFANRAHLLELAAAIEHVTRSLAQSFSVGNVIKNGIPVAIVGETNAGKSTLLNRLLKEERAIVSDIHGTTRDSIEDTMTVDGVLFRFIDTAGIRATHDTIEQLGIERTFKKLDQASIVLWVVDSTKPMAELEALSPQAMERTEGKKLLLALNKADKLSLEERQLRQQYYSSLGVEFLFLSAKNDVTVQPLEQLLVQAAALPQVGEHDVIVTNLRHYEALTKALEAIVRVKDGLNAGISGDFLAQDIRECIYYIGEITGQITTDEILGNIFGRFCIGK